MMVSVHRFTVNGSQFVNRQGILKPKWFSDIFLVITASRPLPASPKFPKTEFRGGESDYSSPIFGF
jgi:hypothetical protein